MNKDIKQQPLVSIISPVYDKERYIKETIDSVLDQTFLDWELILIDDGSSDRSMEIASSYSDERINTLYRRDFTDKRGASVCRNIGIKKACGKFIMFLDSDDLLKSDCLAKRLDLINNYPDYDMWVMNMSRFEGTIKNIKSNRLKDKLNNFQYKISIDKREFMLKKFLTYNTLWSICNPIWRSKALSELGGFQEQFQRLQDPEIHTRALLSDLRIKFMKFEVEPDVLVRSDEDRRGSINNKQMFERITISIENYINTIKPILLRINKKDKVRYLYCYSLLIEQITNGYSNSTEASEDDKKAYVDRREDFYKRIDLPLSSKYLRLVMLYRKLSQSSILRKFKIPAILVNIYKLIV